jgi:ATP-dependent Clp protease ATP-binding subunit ClpX
MFELPSRTDVAKCVINRETIERGMKPLLISKGGSAIVEPPAEESA